VIRIYRAILRFYPRGFRSSFGEEILATLCRLDADRASGGPVRRIFFSAVEIAGLVAGIFVQRLRLRRSNGGSHAPASPSGPGLHDPVTDPIAEAKASVRFHLAQTVDCIAHHRFDGARFHAREEALARQRLGALQQSSR
jgi:hypothetical protein